MGGRSLGIGPVALLASLGVTARIQMALHAAADDLINEWQDVLNTPGEGKIYRRHQASKPGDPPAPDTAALRQSIDKEEMDDGSIRVGTGLDYGRHLEFGTAHIDPRPHARPARDVALAGMNDTLKATLGGKRGKR